MRLFLRFTLEHVFHKSIKVWETVPFALLHSTAFLDRVARGTNLKGSVKLHKRVVQFKIVIKSWDTLTAKFGIREHFNTFKCSLYAIGSVPVHNTKGG